MVLHEEPENVFTVLFEVKTEGAGPVLLTLRPPGISV